MPIKRKTNAASRLHDLAKELQQAYPSVEKDLAKGLEPVEAAIAEIDETFKPTHYAEALLNGGADAQRSPACFARDMYSDGSEAEYLLCVTRGPDNHCALCASVCKFNLGRSEEDGKKAGKNGRPEVVVKKTLLIELKRLPIRLKANILDALDGFADAYAAHVRGIRNSLFGGSDVKPETAPPTPTEEVPDPIMAPAEREPESEPEGKVASATESADVDLPAEAWIRTTS